MHIDFEKDRVGDQLEIRGSSNSTISHFSCKNSQQKEDRLECIVVGEGIMIETIIVDILVEKIKPDPQKEIFEELVKLFHFNSAENTAKQLALKQQTMKLTDEASKNLVMDIDKQQKLNIQYFYPPFEQFRVTRMLMSNEYIAVIGDFGTLKIKRQ